MQPSDKPIYQRILLKLSGEALTGESTSYGIDPNVLANIVDEIKQVVEKGVQVGLVIGGGNLFRGKQLSHMGLSRISGDHMGMLGTLMNALALRDVFESQHLSTRILSAIPMSGVVDHYNSRKAIHHLKSGRVVIFAAGTGNPFVTTDSAASLRGIEVRADILLKATNVDGIYSSDPKINKDAKRYEHLNYTEVLKKELAVMDLAAFCQCRDYQLPIKVFDINQPNALLDIVLGKNIGTLVDGDKHEA